jgi:hypothetical protein
VPGNPRDQWGASSTVQGILNYLTILKLAGLIEYWKPSVADMSRRGT